MSSRLPSFTSISNLDAGGSVTAIRTLLYIPATDPTTTETGGLLSPTPPGDSTPGITSASSSASPGVGNNSSSPVIFSTSVPPGAPTITAPAAPVPPGGESTTADSSQHVIHTPSSTRPSTFTSSNPAKETTAVPPAPLHSNRLANGTVAGIVIGVALGVALITFLATLLVLRRRGGSRGKEDRQRSDIGGSSGSARQQARSSEPKQPFVTQTSSASNSFDDFLLQSADDKTVQNEVKTVLDQIELHVENFYQNTQASGSRLADAELAMFHSPYLPSTLASLLSQTNNSVLLIKHALAHFITACITTPSDKDYADWSLLPKDFVLLPNAVRARGSSRSTKQGFTQSMSRWRALTAYLRPNALEDKDYITERDCQINILVKNFSTAFARWQNPRYKDEERVHSLVAIIKDAADKGIWLFSQPSEFQFQWRKLGPSRIAVAPALVKVTDERGQILGEPQVMIDLTAKKV